MTAVSDEVLEAAIAAYAPTKTHRIDRDRMRRAIAAAVSAAYTEGYRKGAAAAEYDDTGGERSPK